MYNIAMFRRSRITVLLAVSIIVTAGCLSGDPQRPGVDNAKSAVTPSKSLTAADVAKLKWIEGTWRGMDGDKPFYERYLLEGSSLVVETLKDETFAEVEDSGRFELKDGEFGKGEGDQRSAASSITDDSIQFVPAVSGKRNNFRFERQPDGTWNAILEWPATADKPARQKTYKMEPWPRKE
jgi:hypothetical protein